MIHHFIVVCIGSIEARRRWASQEQEGRDGLKVVDVQVAITVGVPADKGLPEVRIYGRARLTEFIRADVDPDVPGSVWAPGV